MKVLFVEYPKCSTCKKAGKWLKDHDVEFDDRHIVEENPTAEELKEWHAKSGLPLKRFFNTSGQVYRNNGIKDKLLGMSEEEAEKSAVESLKLVGISKEYYHLSPMELSGGQKRCVAIAGVLAMQPEILVLDEPAAGLDPETKNEIFELLCRIRKERNNAIVLVSHHMEDVAQFANRVWVMHEGKIAMDGTPEEVYGRVEELEEMHIGIPQITHLTYSLIQEGLPLPRPAINVADAEEMLVRIFKGEKER